MNPLSFVDNTILFTLRMVKSLKLIMQTIRTYKDTSGYLINCQKTHFMVHQNVFDSKKKKIKRIIGIKQKHGITTQILNSKPKKLKKNLKPNPNPLTLTLILP